MGTALDEEYLSVGEAAERLGVSGSTIWRWVGQGRLPAYRVGPRRLKLKVADVAAAVVPARPAEDRRVWMRLKDHADVTPFMSNEESEQMGRALEGLRVVREKLLARRGGVPFPPLWKELNEMRDERTRHLMCEDEMDEDQ